MASFSIEQIAPGDRFAASGVFARSIAQGIGLWVCISGMLWEQSVQARHHTWLVGAAVLLVGLAAITFERARWLNTLVALWWVFASRFVFHLDGGVLVHNVVVGLALALVSVAPTFRPLPATHTR